MMDDNAVAKLVVSSIIGEQVVELEPRPQEYATEKKKKKNTKDEKVEDSTFTVYRLDFSAKIKTPNGHKLILIEMQKASVPTDIMRFRSYLGKQYCDVSNSIISEQGKSEPLQIYAIYFLGKELGIRDTPVLSVNPEVRDVATQEVVKERSRFLESLNHRCWVVQISCLKQRRRNEMEQLLSVFDQENSTSDIHILNVREEDFPEKYRPVIRRLKMAAGDQEVKRKMQEEDKHIRYLQDIERGAHHKGRIEGEAIGLEKGEAIGIVKGRAEGEAIGIEKGESIGIEKGRAEGESIGIEKGRAEGESERSQLQDQNAKLEADLKIAQAEKEALVIKSINAGIPPETISIITGLSIEEIIQLTIDN